jgi:hypothetical protein
VARGLLGRVRPGERQVGGLVTHDPAKLVDPRPIREDPDQVRIVGREGAEEAVSEAYRRWRLDGLDEGDECLGYAQLDAGFRQCRQPELDICDVRMGDADTIRLNVHTEGMHVLEVGKLFSPDGERAVGRDVAQVRDADTWLHSTTLAKDVGGHKNDNNRRELVLSNCAELAQDARPTPG